MAKCELNQQKKETNMKVAELFTEFLDKENCRDKRIFAGFNAYLKSSGVSYDDEAKALVKQHNDKFKNNKKTIGTAEVAKKQDYNDVKEGISEVQTLLNEAATLKNEIATLKNEIVELEKEPINTQSNTQSGEINTNPWRNVAFLSDKHRVVEALLQGDVSGRVGIVSVCSLDKNGNRGPATITSFEKIGIMFVKDTDEFIVTNG